MKRGVSQSRYQAALREIAAVRNIPVDNLRGSKRDQATCMARWLVWRDLYSRDFSLTGIGKAAKRHHTTVLYGIKCAEAAELGVKFIRPCHRPKPSLALMAAE